MSFFGLHRAAERYANTGMDGTGKGFTELVALAVSSQAGARLLPYEFGSGDYRAFRESLRAVLPCAVSIVERFLAGHDRQPRCNWR